MELFAIILSLPGGLVVGLIYVGIASTLAPNLGLLIKPLVYASTIILLGFICELILLGTLGPVRSRGLLGPTFVLAHYVIFIFGAPAAANVLTLPPRMRYPFHELAAIAAFALMFFGLVFMQYGVSEALYGVNGNNGPFSSSAFWI